MHIQFPKAQGLWRDCKGVRRTQPMDGNQRPAERPLRLRAFSGTLPIRLNATCCKPLDPDYSRLDGLL